ncbi:hypothetical protein Pcinc_034028 [Petrolisthes cinctipes]|uniref:Protein kinase domain-containing protein n=1 Tax=Petrolisthes cinctipes TaxID=88211 RepID=A0AAE1ER38_PETCI|nr:hypothetical protein Pcinc_034028 [Petrolisthes cinctipes]
MMIISFRPGKTLESCVPRLVRQPLPTRLRTIASIVRRLREIHEAGIIHHDIKSDNILLSEMDGVVSFIDFGLGGKLGKIWRNKRSRKTERQREFRIYSPEFLQCHPSGPHMDVYSLGMMLAEIIKFRPTSKFFKFCVDNFWCGLFGNREATSTPYNTTLTPQHITTAPQHTTTPPQHIITPPQHTTTLTPQHTTTPPQPTTTLTPQHTTTPPQHTTTLTPQHTTTPPQHTTTPPQHTTTLTPQHTTTLTPQHTTTPPQHTTTPPQHTTTPPSTSTVMPWPRELKRLVKRMKSFDQHQRPSVDEILCQLDSMLTKVLQKEEEENKRREEKKKLKMEKKMMKKGKKK